MACPNPADGALADFFCRFEDFLFAPSHNLALLFFREGCDIRCGCDADFP
jgi:hypothetical protein